MPKEICPTKQKQFIEDHPELTWESMGDLAILASEVGIEVRCEADCISGPQRRKVAGIPLPVLIASPICGKIVSPEGVITA